MIFRFARTPLAEPPEILVVLEGVSERPDLLQLREEGALDLGAQREVWVVVQAYPRTVGADET